MTPERLEELRKGKCGEKFEKWLETEYGSSRQLSKWDKHYIESKWNAWAESWDAAMREVAEEAVDVRYHDRDEFIAKLATYGEEKHNGQQAT